MLGRVVRTLCVMLVVASALAACGGSHSSLPSLPGSLNSTDARVRAQALTAAAALPNGDVAAINSGGAAAGGFAADTDYVLGSTWVFTSTNTIATTGISNPAPQAVYQTQRTGKSIAYTIPGLTPGAAYSVTLSFAELFWTAAKQRVFNVSINGTTVLSNFDVFATAGSRYTAIQKSFSAVANSSGSIAIVFTAVTDNAAVSAIEVAPAGSLDIDAGGPATGNFVADEYYTPGANSFASSGSGTINTSGVTNPAPQGVWLTQRVGPLITYTIPGLTPGAAYTVRLDFAELFWTAAGQRIFNVSINNTQVLTSFDVFAKAGGKNIALAETFGATASAAGTISLTLTGKTNYAMVNGIEITPGAPPSPTPTPSPSATPAFNNWSSYGYDAARTGFNPNTANITPATIGTTFHLAWQDTIRSSMQSQPIVITGVAGHAALLVVATFANAQAYDALTGARVWSTSLPVQDVQDCGIGGISGTAAYDPALNAIFMAAGRGAGAPNHPLLYRLDVATGAITGSVDLTPTLLPGEANYAHGGLSFTNGLVYIGTGSDCEGTGTGAYTAWRGQVIAVNPSTMTVSNRFYTTYNQPGAYAPKAAYPGGGVWGWGGISSDPSGNVYFGSGNSENANAALPQTVKAPFVAAPNEQSGYAEQLVKIDSDLTTVEGSNYPGFNFTIGLNDLDYSGTPVVFQPPLGTGCDLRVAEQGKGGKLTINDAATMAVTASYDFSIPSGAAYYVGNPGYSPTTGFLYAAITSSGAGSSTLPPGLAALSDCGSTLLWHAQFGPDSSLYSGENPRSAPTVTAGGVVFIGTPCSPNGSGGCGTPNAVGGALWAVNATSGTVLNGGNPIVITGDNIRMAPSADGDWLFLIDDSGNAYGFTVDPSYKAIAAKAAQHVSPSLRFH